MGINHIYGLVKTMISKCDKIQGDRKLTNHSVRKHLMQKCNDLGLPTNCTIQLSGHRNVGSANSYSKINDKQQKLISSALTKSPSTFASSENRALVPSNSLNHTYAALTEQTNNIEPPAILAPSPNAQQNMAVSNSTRNVSYSNKATSSTSQMQSIFQGSTVIHGGVFNFYNSESKCDKAEYSPPKKYKRILPVFSDSD